MGATASGRPGGEALLRVLTWNISAAPGCRNKSAKAPEGWTGRDNLERVQQEVLRWSADVVALQECPSAEALAQLGSKYVFVGASAAHAQEFAEAVAKVGGASWFESHF